MVVDISDDRVHVLHSLQRRIVGMDLNHGKRARCGAKDRPTQESFVNDALDILHRTKTCRFPGCSTIPSFGEAGTMQPTFCAVHASSGMRDVPSMACRFPLCNTRATLGFEDVRKAERCTRHAEAGMISSRTRCSWKDRALISHVDVGEENVSPHGNIAEGRTRRECAQPECATIAGFGTPGSRKRESCSRHAKKGIISSTRMRRIRLPHARILRGGRNKKARVLRQAC